MRGADWALIASFAIHVAAAAGAAGIPKDALKHTTTVAVVTSKPKPKKKAAPDDPKPETPPPPEPRREAPRAAAKRPAPPKQPSPADNAPPPPAAEAKAAAAGAAPGPDFGLSLSGAVTGGPGLAIAAGGGLGSGAPGARGDSALGPAPGAQRPRPKDDDDCAGDVVKPKPEGAVQPQYTDAARAASVEGRVMLSLDVDATGKVVGAQVTRGLGYGLDEAAVAAAKRMRFAPATRCGRPVQATFVVSMRFVLGE